MRAGIKLELVAPAAADNAPVGSLSLAALAALTPSDVSVSYTDDFLEPQDLDGGLKDVDLVGITCGSKSVHRAYEIADAYRCKGAAVVLGGIHPTALPDEALQHADAVVVGEAEGCWEKLLADFRRGCLERLYRRDGFTPCEEIVRPNRDLFRDKAYFPLGMVQATRGCPHLCEFCSVRRFFGGSYRFRSCESVIDEIRFMKQKVIMFVDDNIVGHRAYSRQLFQALIPLKKRWIGQASLAALEDEATVKLLARSGCAGLFLGFESLSEASIRACRKYQNKPGNYRAIVDSLHRHGIAIWGSFMFGLDHDDENIFEDAVRFAVDNKLFTAVFAVLTPYPGTAVYERLMREGRLTEARWWLQKDPERQAPHFQPRKMSREQLRRGWQWAWKEFYSFASICKRFQWEYPPTITNKLIYFPFNGVQHRFARKRIVQGQKLRWGKLPWNRR